MGFKRFLAPTTPAAFTSAAGNSSLESWCIACSSQTLNYDIIDAIDWCDLVGSQPLITPCYPLGLHVHSLLETSRSGVLETYNKEQVLGVTTTWRARLELTSQPFQSPVYFDPPFNHITKRLLVTGGMLCEIYTRSLPSLS